MTCTLAFLLSRQINRAPRLCSGRLMMLRHSAQASLLLIVLMGMKVYGQGCPIGRFGAGCRLECHCEQSQDCDAGGECPKNGPCSSPYFGPGCQYVDLILTHGTSDIPEYIRDGNDSTCNPDTNASFVQLNFSSSLWLVWYRIRANNNITLFNRNLTTMAGAAPCFAVNFYRVDDTTLDIRCHTIVAITNMTIAGLVAPYICTINISGGRNVALHQSPRQTSNYSGYPLSKVRAENAVDGNVNPHYASGSCSRTNAQSTLPNWLLIFDQPKWINRIVIHNTYANPNWLRKFEMATFAIGGRPNFYYKDHSPRALSVYDVLLNAGRVVKSLKIQPARLSNTRVTLSLCEVQVFGEAACSSDLYGFDCEHQCHCTADVNCSITTGKCEFTQDYICYPGTYGELCEFSCHEHCSSSACEAHTGACLHCVPGYAGEFCNQVCTPWTFGINCSLECSENCAEPCHHITGVCSCVEAFTGQLCSDCDVGWYGDNCTRKCSDLCYMRVCDVVTGECETCIEKHAGLFCDDCPAGYYGAMCDIPCSAYCRNRSCDEVGGACYACIDGYQGEYCNSEIEDAVPPLWILPLIVPFLVLLLACCLFGGGHTEDEEE